MGFRNPFRFAVDRSRAVSTSATTAPTRAAPDPNRGPGGQVEFNLIKAPGNYGWPYCHGDNDAVQRLRLRHRRVRRQVRLRRARRTPRRATPACVDLPPAAAGLDRLRQLHRAGVRLRQRVADGRPRRTASTRATRPTTKFPEYYDGKNFAYEFGRGWIKNALRPTPSGALTGIAPFLDSLTSRS